MGIAAGLAAAGAAASLGSTISNAFSSGPGGSGPGGTFGGTSGAATYIPSAQPQADQLYQNIFNQMAPYANNLPGTVIPQYQQIVSNIQGNPYAALAQQGAGGAAGMAPTLSGYGMGGAASLYGAGNQVLNTAMDPQQALYNRMQQQTVDQSNAVNSMYGLGSSPYGAGVTGQNLNNFNIDWQNAQLQRQMQGIQSAGQAFGGALNLGGQGASDLATLQGLPSQTYLGQQNQQLQGLQALESGYNASFGPNEALANLLQSYLGLGQSATGLAQQGQQQGFNQNQVLGQQLSTALTNPALANLFNGSSNNTAAGLNSYPYIPQPSYYDSSYFDSSPNSNYGNAGY